MEIFQGVSLLWHGLGTTERGMFGKTLSFSLFSEHFVSFSSFFFFLAFSQCSLYSHYCSRAYLPTAHIFPKDREDGVP